MALIYADVVLKQLTEKANNFITQYINPKDVCPWTYRAWPGFGMAGITFPTGFTIPSEIKINRFIWPRGASRWAYMFCLVSAQDLNIIAPKAFGNDGTETNPLKLHLSSPKSDGNGEIIETDMYLLPPKPLSSVLPSVMPSTINSIVDSNNLYLLPLVDERYYWQYVSVDSMSIVDIDTGAEWGSIISHISDKLNSRFGTTITNSDIPTEYLKASHAFILPYESAPFILDAVAYNIGMRVVRQFDGVVKLQSFTDGNTALSNNFINNPGRIVLAGGEPFQDRIKYY